MLVCNSPNLTAIHMYCAVILDYYDVTIETNSVELMMTYDSQTRCSAVTAAPGRTPG